MTFRNIRLRQKDSTLVHVKFFLVQHPGNTGLKKLDLKQERKRKRKEKQRKEWDEMEGERAQKRETMRDD